MKTKLLPLLLLAFATTAFAADLPLDTPTEDFTDNGDGTVLHKKTGLMWQRCAVGQTWNATTSTCDGTMSTMTWDDAMASYSTGKTCDDWRLPRQDELDSITEYGKFNPAINSTIFPNIATNTHFWSASVYANNTDYAWLVDFGSGYDKIGYKRTNYAVRLVRGGHFCSFDPLNTPTADFIDNKDGTVTHKKTGLMWQRCSIGQTWNGTICTGSASIMNWYDATTQTSDLADYDNWRLPTINELNTIVEYKDYNPAINLSVFPNTPSSHFWSASVNAGGTSDAWIVNFSGVHDNSSGYKRINYAVRLVRGEQFLSFIPSIPITTVDLVSTLTANPNPAKKGGDLTYTATITNKGSATATGAKVTFFIAPRFMSYSTASSGCELQSSGLSVVCNVGNLAAGASATKTMTVNLKKAGGISASVSAKANEKDANPADNIGKTATGVKK
jgi:uncharacterized repeat protein (TIGR01451 family)